MVPAAGWQGNTSKQEGLVALSDCVVAIGDDNDFGSLQQGQSQLNIVQLGTCLTQLYGSLKAAAGTSAPAAVPLLAMKDLPTNASQSPNGTVIGA